MSDSSIERPAALLWLDECASGVGRVISGYLASLEALTTLSERDRELVRIAALVTMAAPEDSLIVHTQRALAGGATPDEIVGVLLSIVPMCGVPMLIAAIPAVRTALERHAEATAVPGS
jgi:alkylhydroperoxidase/carboxymuconolactone decarboxylase family protein YurZ